VLAALPRVQQQQVQMVPAVAVARLLQVRMAVPVVPEEMIRRSMRHMVLAVAVAVAVMQP
jgi:hypothetical protein